MSPARAARGRSSRSVAGSYDDARCPSRVVLVAEAPNLSDTFDADKGYLTMDANTDPTGRFMLQLLASVSAKDWDPAQNRPHPDWFAGWFENDSYGYNSISAPPRDEISA